MPPTGKLAPEKIAILTRWVSLGAPWPARDRTAAHARDRRPSGNDSGSDARASAARPSGRSSRSAARTIPEPGRVVADDWVGLVANPIDRFILEGLCSTTA